MKYTTVKDLIEQLQQCNPDDIVLYAYNEYGNTGYHNFVSSDNLVCVDSETGKFILDDNDILTADKSDVDDIIDMSKKCKWVPTVTLFSN